MKQKYNKYNEIEIKEVNNGDTQVLVPYIDIILWHFDRDYIYFHNFTQIE